MEAGEERLSQLRYIGGDNPRAALRIDDQIESQTRLLAMSPMMGRAGREPGTREMVINRSPFVLVYRVLRSRIEILHLLHGRQQWPQTGRRQTDFESFEDEDS